MFLNILGLTCSSPFTNRLLPAHKQLLHLVYSHLTCRIIVHLLRLKLICDRRLLSSFSFFNYHRDHVQDVPRLIHGIKIIVFDCKSRHLSGAFRVMTVLKNASIKRQVIIEALLLVWSIGRTHKTSFGAPSTSDGC